MDKQIYELLKDVGLMEEEVERAFEICPGLNIVDLDKASKCIITLIKNGYPEADIAILLAVNPAILMYEPQVLNKKLKELGDIETKLKDDPFII
ncbi:MAG: hypothetical protein K6F08_03565 [bacterium]|nr:hypothetical protein [bacterium]